MSYCLKIASWTVLTRRAVGQPVWRPAAERRETAVDRLSGTYVTRREIEPVYKPRPTGIYARLDRVSNSCVRKTVL
jgi:hypothetical protein